MFESEFSDRISFTRRNGETFEIDQRRVRIRENENGLMAVSYVAPVFEANDLENFFGGVLASEKLEMNIGGTGDFTVAFRGIVEGKGKNFPQNLDHRIILLQIPKCLDPREDVQAVRVSRFRKGYTLS